MAVPGNLIWPSAVSRACPRSSIWKARPRHGFLPCSLFRGLRLRILGSIALLAGGLVFLVLYLAFWGTHFAWYQNLAVVLSTLLVVPAALIAIWVAWGLGVGRRVWQRTQQYHEL